MMTDAQVRQQVERTDRFIERLCDAVAATVVDPASPREDDHRRGLQRIAATVAYQVCLRISLSTVATLSA